MSFFLNLLALIAFVFISIWIFTPKFDKYRLLKFPENRDYLYRINRNMYFLIFVVCTTPFFLGQFSLIKYGIYFLALIYLLILGKIRIKVDVIVGAYLLFFLWLIISTSYSESRYDSVMLLIKYSIPLLSLWLGYSAIGGKYDLYYFSKSVAKTSGVYALIAGGVNAVFMPWLYFSPFGAMFLTYAGLADYFTSIFVVFFILYWITRRKIYLWGALWLLLSTILEVVRTGLGGMALVGTFFVFFRYKLKSIPYIIVTGILFVSIVLYVPSVNEKFFGKNAGTVDATDIVQGGALSMDNIQTSGRSFLWELAMNKFYKPNPIIGSGLGTTTHFIKERAQKEHTVALLHSDYVQILCDNGIIGIVLLALFYLSIVYKVFIYSWSGADPWIKVSGIMAVSSMAGVAFSMGFDNVVSHSMTSLINPFIFIGFFLKFIDLAKYDSLS